jgi:uncharacterized ferredoxin-like protein
MPILKGFEVERKAIIGIANLMAVSARTAPKARGVDNILTAVVTRKEKDELTDAMEREMERKRNPLSAFKRDAEAVRNSPAVLLLSVKGTHPKRPDNPLNCGACGHETCAEFSKTEKRRGEDFTGPICVFEAIDLRIAIGSAVKTASNLNVDNRLMYTLGAAVKDLQLFDTDADVIIGVPLSATGKNIYFDRI